MFLRKTDRDAWAEAINSLQSHMKHMKDTTFVFSCCAVSREHDPKNNLYMWGHYRNGHRGVAIEFDTIRTSSLLPRHPVFSSLNPVSPEQAWVQVNYREDYSIITPAMFFELFNSHNEKQDMDTRIAQYFRKQVSTKSLAWRQEYEWRILWRNDETRSKIWRTIIPDDAITAVYIGLLSSESSQSDILFELKSKFPQSKCFRAKKKLGFSELDFVDIK